MYRIFKKIIKRLEKERYYNKDDIVNFLKQCEKKELSDLKDISRDYFLYYFDQLYLSMDYNQRIIDSGWEENISKDPESTNYMAIDYSLEEIITYSPFPHYETAILLLARMRCRKCSQEFLAILPFIFSSEAFDFGNGFQWTIKEFPLTTEGYLEASQLYFKILRDITLEKIQTRGTPYLEAYISDIKEKQINTGKIKSDVWRELLSEDRIKKQSEKFWWTHLAVDLPFVNFYEKYRYLRIGTRSYKSKNKQDNLPYHERDNFNKKGDD